MISSKFQFYSRPEYFVDLAERASKAKAGDSITLMTMDFDPARPLIKSLTKELCQAASRGVNVRLIVDAMDFILDKDSKPGPLFYGRELNEHSAGSAGATMAQLEKLRTCGGSYWIINRPSRPFMNPVAGRSHIKLALINDRIYMGGCNLDDETRIDIMAAWEDTETSRWLYELTKKIVKAGNVKEALNGTDVTHQVNEDMTIFVDSGVKKQSVIYDEALACIDDAEESIYITCQYFPGGPTAKHLLAAQKRGANINIVFSGPASHNQPLGHYLYNLRERSRMPASFFANQLPSTGPKMHAKIIATENGAMLGSHNYVNMGVNLGTAEIALLCNDVDFSQSISLHMQRHIA
jgi:phosphatidylserine/phosphatidylglycerophosphate/cardiolipin synthase-like enzyme